ncbi:MAG: protein kinase, partial [Bacteroidota bacterium]
FGQKRLYMVMELVKGERLDKIPHDVVVSDMDVFMDQAIQICTGLESAHKTKFTDAAGMAREGIVHGNVRTRKVLFTEEGVPKIIDFMFADLTRSPNIRLEVPEHVKGRNRAERLEAFFPPEVLEGDRPVDKLTDIYSVGAVLFNVLTRKSIADFHFQSDEALHRFVKKEVRSIPRNLSKAIYVATQKSPRERYQKIEQMISELLKEQSLWKRTLYWFKRK